MAETRDLRRRLQRMRAAQKTQPPQPGTPTALPPGRVVTTPHGAAYRIESTYALDHVHGGRPLQDLLSFQPALAAELAGAPDLATTAPQDWMFLDLETTGLVGGTGTIGFLIGVGAFAGDMFRIRQYFLRDPAEESGMLGALLKDAERAAGIVSFNGRVFDLPLLEMRYALNLRQPGRWNSIPHLDLLHPARRLWRRALPDCRLGTLEEQILRVKRSEEDVPGELIPGLYLDYLRTGDASAMARVVYHNAVDILSLVGLATALLERHHGEGLATLSGEEALAIARWHQGAGRNEPAEAAYRSALDQVGRGGMHREVLRNYTAYLKREGRRDEAVGGWLAWHEAAPDDPAPCVELAMYYEWHAPDLGAAHRWAQEALLAVSRWPGGWRRDQARQEIEHRLHRLERKLATEPR